METLDQKKRRLAGKALYLDTYIKTLNKVTFKKIDATMLLPIIETDRLMGPVKSIDYIINYETTLDFCDKKNAWETIKKVFGDSSLYLYLEHVRECGLCPLESIDMFNIDFDFEDDPGEMIVLVSKNCQREVVLDFYEEDDKKKIDIEVRSIIKNSHIQDSLVEIKRALGDFIFELRNKKGINEYQVSQTKRSSINCNNALSLLLFQYIDGYHIKKDDREIYFKLALHDGSYLQIAQIGKEIIAVDLQQINELNEWNIINYNTKYVITQTFDDFFSNKVWDWIDKKKTIWKKG